MKRKIKAILFLLAVSASIGLSIANVIMDNDTLLLTTAVCMTLWCLFCLILWFQMIGEEFKR